MLRAKRANLFISCIFFGLFFLQLACQTTNPGYNYVHLGNQYARDGLLREAVDAYQQAIAIQSNNLAAHRNLGMVLVKIGNYKSAAKHLEKASKVYLEHFETNFYLGEAYRGMESFTDAIYYYQKALKLQENDVKAMKALAWTYYRIHYYSAALSIGQSLQKVAPKDPQAAIIVARTLLKVKRSNQALATIQKAKAVATARDLPFLASVEGDVYFEAGHVDRAATLYRQALKEEPLLPGALLGLGKCMLNQKKGDEAIPLVERALRTRPKMPEAYFLLAKAYEGKDPTKSLKYYQAFHKQILADPEFLGLLGEVQNKISSLQGGSSQPPL